MKTIKRIFVCLLTLVMLASPASAEIKAGKAIIITISGVPPEEKGRFDQKYPVADNGTINMPFIGKVRAAGLKTSDLALVLQKRYMEAEIYTSPTFQVVANDQQDIDQQLVHIGGFVRAPGPKPFMDKMTIWQAIQAAGGPDKFGSMNRVTLTRGGKVAEFDITDAKNQQILLKPGDSIEVPQKNIWGK